MKKFMGTALSVTLLLTLCGCGSSHNTQPTPTASAQALSRFESYVTQTAFHFPKNWEYQDDESVTEGMTALFTFDGGQAAVQFLWMDEAQEQSNVFLQQLEMDDVTTQAYAAGPYEGTLASGTEGDTYSIAFEGCRSWYNIAPKLYVRILLQVQGADPYAAQCQSFIDLLASVTVTEDDSPPAVEQSMLEKYNFKEDFGLSLTAPNSWALMPDYDIENGYIALDFEAAAGGNIYRVECAAVSQEDYDEIVQSLRDIEHNEDVYNYAYWQKNGVHGMTCLQEGKINHVRLEAKKVNGKIRYLWVSCALRPVLDVAYYETIVVPSFESIDWE